MKVKQLIKELKKMPQNLDVQVIMHDNYEWEGADIFSINHFIKSDNLNYRDLDKEMFDNAPNDCIIIVC